MSVPFKKRLQSYIPKSLRDLFRSIEFRQSTERELKNLTLKENDFASDSFDLPPSQHSTKEYISTEINSAVTGLLDYKGGYDAATNTPNLDSSPPAGTIFKGDFYTVDNGGTFYTRQVEPGDGLIAEVDDPSQESDWTVVVGSSGSIYTIDGVLSGNRTVSQNGNSLTWDLGNGSQLFTTSSSSGTWMNFRVGGSQKGALLAVSGGGAMYFRDSGGSDYYSLSQNGFGLNRNAGIGLLSGVSARLHVKGSGSTNATTAFLVENSNGNDILNIKGDGTFTLGRAASSASDSNVVIGEQASGPSVYGTVVGSNTSIANAQASYATIIGHGSSTSSAQNLAVGANCLVGFKGTSVGYGASGTGNYAINLGHDADGSAARSVTINASSGTAAPSTEFEFGVYMTSNTTPDFRVIGDEGMVPPSITTTVRDAIASPLTGSTIYNTTDNKLQFYDGTNWGNISSSIYTGNGSINEDRVITVGYPTSDPKNTYVTTFESNKTVGSQNSQKNVSGTQIAIKETVNNLPVSYGQTRGAVLKLQHQNTSGSVSTESYIQSFSINSGSSDYSSRDQMGFRTNKAFVFKATNTSWPLYFTVEGGPSNNRKIIAYSGQQDGGLLQLKSANAKTAKITLADTSSTPGTNGYYRYISGGNNGNLILGRRLNGQSEQAYITCSGVGSWSASEIAVGINQGTPTSTLHVTGSGTTSATTSLIVENSNGDDILNVRDDQYVTITGNNGINNFFILKNDATWTMLDAGDAGSNNGQLRIKSSNNNRFWFKADDGLAIADAGAVTLDSSAVLKVDSSSKGFLPPRNSDPASNISNPTTGLIAYDTTDNELQFYNGSAWTSAGGGSSSPWTVSGNDIYYNTGAVSVGTTTPNASAAVQVDSTTQGFLPPRMTTAQRTAISSPAEGLMVFDTDLKQWMGYDSTQWVVIG